MKQWYKSFSSQPHNSFFANGIIFFILFISILFLQYSNSLNLQTTLLNYHAYSMIHIVFIQFFIGFLYVVFPRFLVQAQIKQELYMKHFLLYFLGSLGFFISTFFNESLLLISAFLLLLAQILSFITLFKIHKDSKVKNRDDTKWILVFFFFGLISHLLFLISFFDFEYSYFFKRVGVNSGFYIFLFGIIFSVSQRMIPFFSQMKLPEYKINKSKDLLFFVSIFLVLKVIFLMFENSSFNLIPDIALFFIFVKELIKWRLPFFKVPAIMWVLYLSLYWIPIAFFLSIVEGAIQLLSIDFIFEKAVVHTLALGYFVTVLIGFGTRVVLGHSGRTVYANKTAISIFIFLQAVALLRIFTSFTLNMNLDYLYFINLSSIFLLLGLFIWSSKYLGILLKGK